MINHIIDCVRTDRTSDDENREALRYLEFTWQNRLGYVTVNGNINHLDELRARGNSISAKERIFCCWRICHLQQTLRKTIRKWQRQIAAAAAII